MYVLLLLGLSFFYLEFYKDNPNHFSYNSDGIQTKEVMDRKTSRRQASNRIRKKLKASVIIVDSIKNLVSKDYIPSDTFCETTKNGSQKCSATYKYSDNSGIGDNTVKITLYYALKDGKIFFDQIWSNVNVRGKNTSHSEQITLIDREKNKERIKDNFKENEDLFKEVLLKASESLERKIANPGNMALRNNLSNRKLDYQDFLYFTIVSVTGKVNTEFRPNSKPTKLLMSLQPILTGLLLILFFNAKFGELKNQLKKAENNS